MNKRIILLLLSLCLLTGCGKEKTESDELDKLVTDNVLNSSIEVDNTYVESYVDIDMTEELSEATEEKSPVFASPYKYYDVFRKEYEMMVNPDFPANPLKADCFQYIDKDPSGRELVSDIFSFEKPLKAADGQLVGYEGIIKYEDDNYTSKYGVDVSKFQGDIDWNKVREAGVEFAVVRIGFRAYGKAGDLHEDPYYKKNIEGAHNAGLDVGVYFYAQAINEEEAVEEADFVLKLLDGYSLELPIVYDPEHVLNDEARTDNVTGEQFTKNALAFCNRIKEAGQRPMIYANMLWQANQLDLSELTGIELWHADYEYLPQTPYEFTMWQYSQKGNVAGIKGGCDLNLMLVEKE